MSASDALGRTLAELSVHAVVGEDSVVFPGAQPPERTRNVLSDGVRIAVHEWGSESDPVLFLLHGGLDFARTMDVFAPHLAAGGWRVVSWDHRSHGDSEWAAMTSWTADVRDAAAVINATTTSPAPIVGHSKGGALALRLAESWSHRFTHLVNIDGLPSKRPAPDVTDHERTRMRANDLTSWLDNRQRGADGRRKPGTLEELAKRRARMNPRLTHEWLCYLVTVGAARDDDGWRWKIDPMMRPGGFGPWRPEWQLVGLPGLQMPFLGCLGSEQEAMGWGTDPEDIRAYLPVGGRLEVFEHTGHFIHIERPADVAEMVLEFLA